MIIVALMPLWFFVVTQLFSLVFNGRLTTMGMPAIGTAYIVSFMIAVILFPNRHYGRLTDKKAGSDWLLVPASGFEKFLSLVLVCCLGAPILWLAVAAASDGLLTVLLPTYYNGMGLYKIVDGFGYLLSEFKTTNVSFAMSSPWSIYLSWCSCILTFALGAIFFKKNKVGYTILALMGIGILLSLSAGIFFGGDINIDTENITEDGLMQTLNAFVWITYVVEFTLLLLGIYFRIKTIKH